jgi:hypothetical protein
MYLVASDHDKSGQENSKSTTQTHPISYKSQRLLCQVPAYRQIVLIREISMRQGKDSSHQAQGNSRPLFLLARARSDEMVCSRRSTSYLTEVEEQQLSDGITEVSFPFED